MRWYAFLPFAALTVFAAYLAWQKGQTPSETAIINHYAAAYLAMAPTGAQASDCLAVPHRNPTIRMVVTCTHPSGLTTRFYVGHRGEALPEPQGPTA